MVYLKEEPTQFTLSRWFIANTLTNTDSEFLPLLISLRQRAAGRLPRQVTPRAGLQIRLWRIKYEYDSFFLWRCADVARRSRYGWRFDIRL